MTMHSCSSVKCDEPEPDVHLHRQAPHTSCREAGYRKGIMALPYARISPDPGDIPVFTAPLRAGKPAPGHRWR